MTAPDIQILVGETFTTARVGGQLVAVKWTDNNGAYYVADGSGPASKLDSQSQATGRMMAIAMQAAGGGAATVATVGEPR